jgi:hypothetical protein
MWNSGELFAAMGIVRMRGAILLHRRFLRSAGREAIMASSMSAAWVEGTGKGDRDEATRCLVCWPRARE